MADTRVQGISAGPATPVQSPNADPALFGAAGARAMQDTADVMASSLKEFNDKRDAEDLVYFQSRLTRDMAAYSSELEVTDENGIYTHPDANKPRSELYRRKSLDLLNQYKNEKGMSVRLQKRLFSDVVAKAETSGYEIDAQKNAHRQVIQSQAASEQVYNNTLYSLDGLTDVKKASDSIKEGLDSQNILIAAAKSSGNLPLYNFHKAQRDNLAVDSALKMARLDGGLVQARSMMQSSNVSPDAHDKFELGIQRLSNLTRVEAEKPVTELFNNILYASPEAITSAETNLAKQETNGLLDPVAKAEIDRKLNIIKSVSSADSVAEATKRIRAARIGAKDDPSMLAQLSAAESSIKNVGEGDFAARKKNLDLVVMAQHKAEGITDFTVNGIVNKNAVADDVGDLIKTADSRADTHLSDSQRMAQVSYPVAQYVASAADSVHTPLQYADMLSSVFQAAENKAAGTDLAVKSVLQAYDLNKDSMNKYGRSMVALMLINQQNMTPAAAEFAGYTLASIQDTQNLVYNKDTAEAVKTMFNFDKGTAVSQQIVEGGVKSVLMNNQKFNDVTSGYNYQYALSSNSTLMNSLVDDMSRYYAAEIASGRIKDKAALNDAVDKNMKTLFPYVYIDGIAVNDAMTPYFLSPDKGDTPYTVTDMPWLGGNRSQYLKDQLDDSFRNELEQSAGRNWSGRFSNWAARSLRDNPVSSVRTVVSGFLGDDFLSERALYDPRGDSVAMGPLTWMGDLTTRNSSLPARDLREKLERGDVHIASVAYRSNGEPLFVGKDPSEWPAEVARGVKDMLKADAEGAKNFNLDTMLAAFKSGDVVRRKVGTTADGKSIVSIGIKNIPQNGGRTVYLANKDGTEYTYVLEDAVGSLSTYSNSYDSDGAVGYMKEKLKKLNEVYQQHREANELLRQARSKGISDAGQ